MFQRIERIERNAAAAATTVTTSVQLLPIHVCINLAGSIS
jgi:hypothetical protein